MKLKFFLLSQVRINPGKFLFSLQLKSEKVSFHYNEIAVMMEDYANLVSNVGNGFQSTHTILHATEVSSNGKTLLG